MKTKFRRTRRERSCLYFFKLETAVIIFTFLDILFFCLLIRMATYGYASDIWEFTGETKKVIVKAVDGAT